MYTVIGITPQDVMFIGRLNGKTCCCKEKKDAESFALACKSSNGENRYFVGRVTIGKHEICRKGSAINSKTSQRELSGKESSGEQIVGRNWSLLREVSEDNQLLKPPPLPNRWLVGYRQS